MLILLVLLIAIILLVHCINFTSCSCKTYHTAVTSYELCNHIILHIYINLQASRLCSCAIREHPLTCHTSASCNKKALFKVGLENFELKCSRKQSLTVTGRFGHKDLYQLYTNRSSNVHQAYFIYIPHIAMSLYDIKKGLHLKLHAAL